MATKYETVEVWVLIDDGGNYVASDDADTLNDRFEEAHNAVSECEGTRRVKITVKVPVPTVIEVEAEVVEEEEAGSVAVAG